MPLYTVIFQPLGSFLPAYRGKAPSGAVGKQQRNDISSANPASRKDSTITLPFHRKSTLFAVSL